MWYNAELPIKELSLKVPVPILGHALMNRSQAKFSALYYAIIMYYNFQNSGFVDCGEKTLQPFSLHM